MRDIIFGMAVGSVLGVLLYKNNQCAKQIFDEAQKTITKEIEKMEEAGKNPDKKQKQNNNKE